MKQDNILKKLSLYIRLKWQFHHLEVALWYWFSSSYYNSSIMFSFAIALAFIAYIDVDCLPFKVH